MPRPKSANPNITKHIPINPDLLAQIELKLFSDVEGRVPYGAWTGFIESLLRQHLAAEARREAFKAALITAGDSDDKEQNHSRADQVLVEELEALGYDLSTFKSMGKWYG